MEAILTPNVLFKAHQQLSPNGGSSLPKQKKAFLKNRAVEVKVECLLS